MSSEALKITAEDVDSAQDKSRMLLGIVGSCAPNIGIGALIMATTVAAREMNIPQETIAALFGRTLEDVYAAAIPGSSPRTIN
jgi:hypothetical protein